MKSQRKREVKIYYNYKFYFLKVTPGQISTLPWPHPAPPSPTQPHPVVMAILVVMHIWKKYSHFNFNYVISISHPSQAPAIFQEIMEKLLHGISGVVVTWTTLITGGNEGEQLTNLMEVLNQFKECLARIKASKMLIPCTWGYCID